MIASPQPVTQQQLQTCQHFTKKKKSEGTKIETVKASRAEENGEG